MAGSSARVLVRYALEDLSSDDLNSFIAQMREARDDNHKPERFRKAQVEKKTPQQLADLLVDAFADKAVAVTLWLLRAINQNQVANELEAEAEELPAPKKKNSGEASGAKGNKKHFVDSHRDQLIDRVCNINPILDYLFQRKVLNQEQYDRAMDIRPKQDQMRFLFRGPLMAGGNRSKDVLVSALEELEPCLMEDLQQS